MQGQIIEFKPRRDARTGADARSFLRATVFSRELARLRKGRSPIVAAYVMTPDGFEYIVAPSLDDLDMKIAAISCALRAQIADNTTDGITRATLRKVKQGMGVAAGFEGRSVAEYVHEHFGV